MRATVMYKAGDVRVENVPDARLIEPTDALMTVSRACICGSDLWPYNLMEPAETGRRADCEGKRESRKPVHRGARDSTEVTLSIAQVSQRPLGVFLFRGTVITCNPSEL